MDSDEEFDKRKALAKLCMVGIVLLCATAWFFGRAVS